MKKLLLSFFFAMVLFVWSGTVSELQAQTNWLPTTQYSSGTTNWNWGTSTNWSPATVPNVADAVVNINSNINVNQAITLGANRTVGTLNIGDDTNNFTLTGSTLIFDVSSGNAALNVLSTAKTGGMGQISSGVQLNDNLVVTINKQGASLPFYGSFTASSGKTLTLTTGNGVTSTDLNTFGANNTTAGNNNFSKLIISGGYKFNYNRTPSTTDDKAFGAIPGSPTADAITLDNGLLSAAQDNKTYYILANRGITLNAGGGDLYCGDATRAWVVQSIITGSGALTLSGSGSKTLNAVNDYTGATSITGGTLILGASASLANTSEISIASGATFDVSAPGFTLGTSQPLKANATGSNTTSTITVASSKNLTLGGSTTGLQFTAYGGGATSPLTVNGASAGSLDLNSKPITVTTTTALAIGTYKLIAKAGSATVTGTPGTLTVDGSELAANTTASLQINNGELELVVSSNVATYNVTYNGNGNEGGAVPANQTKVEDTPLPLQTNSGNLTISGKNFNGWNTAADGSGASYAAGGTYNANEAVTLYAKWLTVDTYTISFDGNGNTGGDAPGNQTKTQNVTQNIPLTLATNSGNLVKTGYSFAGWNTAANGTGTTYAAGGSFTTDATTTLYALWVATVTETFETETSTTQNGWTGSGNTASGNNFKWSNTSTVSGSVGEAGGSFARSVSYRYFANTSIGTYERTNTLRMQGSFKLNNQDFDGNFYLGYFKIGAQSANFAGISIAEPSGATSNPFRASASVNGTGGASSAQINLTQDALLSYDLTWNGNADGSGTLSGTLAGTPVNVAVAAGSGSYDAFGLMVGGSSSDNINQNTINCFFDDLTYNMNSQTAEWNGTAWSNGGPNSYKSAVVSGNISTTGFTTNNLTVNAGKQLSITSGTLTVNGNFTLKSSVDGTATFINSGTLAVTGQTNVEQYLARSRNWYMSSPVSGATVMPAVSSGSLTFYSYPENHANQLISGTNPFVWSAGNYWITPEETSFTAAKGYIVKPTVASTLSFSGTSFNSGEKTIGLTYSNDNPKKGFNLVGNPYPAYLNILKAFDTDNDNDIDENDVDNNILPTYWVRTQEPDFDYTWDTYNLPGEIVANGSTLDLTKFISPMQAIWMRAKTISGATLTLNSSMCSHQDVPNNKFRTRSSGSSNNQVVRLKVSNGINSDETVLYANEKASNNFDIYDSPKMSNANNAIPEIYTQIGSEQLVINGMNSLVPDTEIPLGFMTKTANTFSINASEIVNLPDGVKVILKDNGTEFDLSNGAAYNFNSDVTTTSTRFSILFRSPGISTEVTNPDKEHISVFVNTQNKIVISAKEGSNYAIYNAVGQLIENGQTTVKLQTANCKLQTGLYVVKVGSVTERVIVK